MTIPLPKGAKSVRIVVMTDANGNVTTDESRAVNVEAVVTHDDGRQERVYIGPTAP